MPNYAVIDLGSNSIRMVVYNVGNDRRKTYTRDHFSTLINDKIMAGLATYVEEGVLSDLGIRKATRTLRGHLKRAEYFHCKRIDIFATAVLRNVKNCKEALAEIETNINHKIELLSGREEAHLGFVGAACAQPIEQGTLIDIGGGSTELTSIENGQDTVGVSIPLGSLSAFSTIVCGVLPCAEEVDTIAQRFKQSALKSPKIKEVKATTLYGIGGSIRAAAKLQAQVDKTRLRPKSLTSQDVAGLVQLCVDDPHLFAHNAIAAAAERVHTIAPGCIILGEVFKLTGATDIKICKCGVREGYLIERVLC